MTNQAFHQRRALARDFPQGSRVMFGSDDPRKSEGVGTVEHTGRRQVYVLYDDGPDYAIGTYPKNLTLTETDE